MPLITKKEGVMNNKPATNSSGAATVRVASGSHGEVRGINLSQRSSQFEGRFGRMFRTLPPGRFDEEMLIKLGKKMKAEKEPGGPTPEDADPPDDEENIGTKLHPGISAGYTYLGQFIDHDLTFDPASSLERDNDPDGLVDYRTPRFDLDCVYGRGPDDQPYLYRDGGMRMLLGKQLTGNDDDPNARGLPRNPPVGQEPSRALIGDPRNDENVIVSQLQSAMLRFHNRVVDVFKPETFAEAQRIVRWHYQWVVLHDFLPTIIGAETWHEILPHVQKGTNVVDDPPRLKFYKGKDPYMPVEFSVAAYRFGHSMIRPVYRINAKNDRLPIFSVNKKKESLAGFRAFPSKLAIDWRLFFDMGNNPPRVGKKRVQPAYKIDTSLVNPLGDLPKSIGGDHPSLAERNLIRGLRMQLPSGQTVSRAMGIQPIDDEKLRVGKANEDGVKTNRKLTDLDPAFAGNAPLWYYILAEAQQQFVKNDTPIHLGPVGGRIVGEVFVGLMMADSYSFLRQDPLFHPSEKLMKKGANFKMADLLKQAKKANYP
jgi:hypothetical protein